MSVENRDTPQGRRDTPANAGDVVIRDNLTQGQSAPSRDAIFSPPPARKGFFARAYEKLSNLPAVKKVVGEIGIARSQRLADKYQEKSVALKGEMDGLDLQAAAIDGAKREMESMIADLQRDGSPGIESLRLQVSNLERDKMKILGQRDIVQSDFERMDNRVKVYINKRDRILDEFIGGYNETLEPLDRKIEDLRSLGRRVDLAKSVAEARHARTLGAITRIETSRNLQERALRMQGKTDKEIANHPSLRSLDKIIAERKKLVADARLVLAKRRDAVDAKIAEIDEQANPYRDKRDAAARIKSGRPLDVAVEARTRVPNTETREAVRSNSRESLPVIDENDREAAPLVVSQFIDRWNTHLAEDYMGTSVNPLSIDPEDFRRETNLDMAEELSFRSINEIVLEYLRFKMVDIDDFESAMDAFKDKVLTEN